MMEKIILKPLKIIIFLFFSCLLIINMYKNNIISIIGIIISLLLVYLTKNKKIDNKTFYILIITPVIIRIVLLFLTYNNIIGDYNFNYISSINYAKGINIDNNYFALFPYLYSYVFLLGNFFKLIGLKYTNVIILNYMFEAIGLYFLIKYIKKKNKTNLKYGVILYLLNPFNIIWDSFAAPIIVVNTLFIICLFLINEIVTCNKKLKGTILTIILGFFLCIFNLYRPIAIILIIAIVLWFLIKTFTDKKIFKKYIIKIIILIITFISFNNIFEIFISENIEKEIPKVKFGWSVMIGSNYEYDGSWNSNDVELFKKMQLNATPEEAQKKALEYGIKRYKENGIKNIWLLLKKANILGNNFDKYSCQEFINQIGNSKYLKTIIELLTSIFIFYIIILNLVLSYKNKNINDLFPTSIYIIGLFIATLLVEVSQRYFNPIFIALLINALIKEGCKE